MLEYLIEDGLVQKGDRIAVGVSGGADSMLLLWGLFDKQKQVDFYMKVIHVNHRLRGKESDRDMKFVEDFCKKKKIPYEIVSVDVKKIKANKKLSLEEAAREARYQAIEDVMKKDNLSKLFLAHHKNDQAETVLMHIFRGSGILGACGMQKTDGKIVRPLLNFKKSEIEKIATDSGISWVIDSTNQESSCTRNFIRNEILPQIEKVYPSVVDAICGFSEKCKATQSFAESKLEQGLVSDYGDGVMISSRVFDADGLSNALYLKDAFKRLEVFADIEEKHFKLLADLNEKSVNTCIDLPHGVVARKTYDGVKLSKKTATEKNSDEKNFETGTHFFDGIGTVTAEIVSPYDVVYGNGSLYVDYNKLPADCIWRTRRVGDKFTMLGTGTRSLSDYFTDEKLEFEQRDKMLLLASREKVLVIAGRDISENVKIDGTTDTIIKITFQQL